MANLGEAARRRSPNASRRRVRTHEIWKARFDRGVASPQRVVFGIGDGWRVVLVIALVVPRDLGSKPLQLGLGLCLGQFGDVVGSFLRNHDEARAISFRALVTTSSTKASLAAV